MHGSSSWAKPGIVLLQGHVVITGEHARALYMVKGNYHEIMVRALETCMKAIPWKFEIEFCVVPKSCTFFTFGIRPGPKLGYQLQALPLEQNNNAGSKTPTFVAIRPRRSSTRTH